MANPLPTRVPPLCPVTLVDRWLPQLPVLAHNGEKVFHVLKRFNFRYLFGDTQVMHKLWGGDTHVMHRNFDVIRMMHKNFFGDTQQLNVWM